MNQCWCSCFVLQLQRQKNMDRACAKDKRRTPSQLSLREKQTLYKHVIVDDEYRFLFCYVPKVASANWKRVLLVLSGKATDVNDIPKVERKGFTFLADLPPIAAERKLSSYFKFMFVREPLDRLVSAYDNKFVLNNTYFHQRYGQQIVRAHRKRAGRHPKGDDVTLDEFFQHLASTKTEEMNEHWMPYYELCQPCAVSYDFVGSFENLLPEVREVLQTLGVEDRVSFPEMQSFYKRVDHSGLDKRIKAIQPKVLKKALKKYFIDYGLFSYRVPKT